MGIIRILLALSVLICHSTPLFGLKLVDGNIAVQLFFIISGFYMAMVLSEKYTLEKDRLFYLSFYKSRFLRLYPVFVIVSVLCWIYFGALTIFFGNIPANGFVDIFQRMPWWGSVLSIFSNITMLGQDIPSLFHVSSDGVMHLFHSRITGTAEDGALWVGQTRTIGQAWSVGSEIWFYLFAPLLISRSVVSIISIAIVSLSIKIFMESNHLLTYFFFPAQLFFFLIGVLAYKLRRTNERTNERTKKMGFLGLSLFSFSIIIYQFVDNQYYQIFLYILLACFIHPIFSITSHLKIDRLIGELSYPIYMIHMLVLTISTNMLHKFLGSTTVPSWIILIVSILFSLAVYFYIDKPLSQYRKRFAK
jgi:peptidoglycan/LPS O-acetylase OafA/YrhL